MDRVWIPEKLERAVHPLCPSILDQTVTGMIERTYHVILPRFGVVVALSPL